MKRTPLKRTGPLPRSTPLKKRRATPRRSARVRDAAYMDWIRQQPCALGRRYRHKGTVHAHHAGPRGFGQKASDDTTIPLCAHHHTAWHDLGWPFRGWSHDERVEWVASTIAYYRTGYEFHREAA